MKVAIVGGTAGLGSALAVRLARAGADVLIGSRDQDKGLMVADRVAEAAGGQGSVVGGENPKVVEDADLVIVTVPFPGMSSIYSSISDAIRPDAAVVDCTVPLASEVGGKATHILGVWEGSAAQHARSILGRSVKFASAFHTVDAKGIEAGADVGDILACGDKDAKGKLREAVELMNCKLVDCGPLENARILESLTALLIGINKRYGLEPGAGVRVSGIS